jgi:electron transfer flavoprotein alpha subunit
MPVTVDLERCVGSRDCLSACAFNAIEVQNGKAVIFENCVDCDMCVLACPTQAIISSTAPATSKGGVLVADVSDRSGVAALVERAAKQTGAASVNVKIDAAEAGAAADALAEEVDKQGYNLIALAHVGAGPAIAARLAAKLGATLISGCQDIRIEEAGGLRATRLRYNGLVRVSTRVAAGRAVATLVPRTMGAFAAQLIGGPSQGETVSDAPLPPEQLARTIVAMPADAPQDVAAVTRAIAQSLGAALVDATTVSGKSLSPELYIAIGVDGSTEHNAAVRGAGTIVALVSEATAPIVQIADYALVGNVREHAQALLAALG